MGGRRAIEDCLRYEDILMHLSIRNGTRNLIGADRLLVGAFSHPKEEAYEDEGERDEEPEGENT